MVVLKVSFMKYFFALTLILVGFYTFAQKLSGGYGFYKVSDGIADNKIKDLICDDNKNCWIASQSGISRFDNFNFINFSSKTDSVFFQDNNVDELYKVNNFIYLMSYRYGLIKLDPSNFKFSRVFNEGLLSMAIKGDSSVYLFTNGKLQFRIKDKLVSERKFGPQEKGSVIFFNNNIYLKLLNAYLLELNPTTLTENHKIETELMKPNGKLVLSSVDGLVYHSGNRVFILDKTNKLKPHSLINDKTNISFYRETSKGEPNYIANYKVPYLFDKNEFLALIFDNTLNVMINAMDRLSNRCYYLGTNQGLIKMILKYNISSPLNDNSFFDKDFLRLRQGIVKGNDSDFYFMGFPGILKYKNNKADVFTFDEIKTNDGVLIKSNLYCATEGNGLISYSTKNKQKEQVLTPHILRNDSFNCISKFNESDIVLGGFEKVIVYNSIKRTSEKYILNKGTDVVKIIIDNKNSCLWLATNKGLLKAKLLSTNNLAIDLPPKIVFDKKINDFLVLSEKNEIWIATDEGVYVLDVSSFKLKRQYTTPDSLSSSKVLSILYNNKKIWASTYSGITVFDVNRNAINYITKSHGSINSEYVLRSSAILDKEHVVFGGLNVYDVLETNTMDSIKYVSSFFISAAELVGNKNSKPYYSRMSINDFDFSFKTGEEDLNLYLANNDFINSGSYSFEYQIDDGNWVLLDEKKIVTLSNLAYGSYKLNIRMINPYGHKSAIKEYRITAFIPLYQRPSARYIRIIIAVVLILVIFYFYIKSIKVENETKSRIAMNLHDEAGTILTRLSLLVQSSKKLEDDKEKINSGINEVLYSLRTFISSMTKSIFTIQELEDELREFITKTFKDSLVNYDFKLIYDENYNLSGELYRDIKLCVYEAVTNSIKHSKCDKFAFSVMAEKKVIELRMVDNGLLTNLSQLTMKGNGIRNIKKRVARNKGEVLFTISEEQKGLALNLKFPIK